MERNFFAHESSYVDDGCTIGNGTKIWHFSHIMSDAHIGENCNISQNVYIESGVLIGNGVKIKNNVSLYDGIVIQDNAFLGPSSVFTNVINPRAFIERKDEFRKTIVKEGASIGANATIICGHSIGRYAFVGAGAVVTKDVPDFAMVYGSPAKVKGYICTCGERLLFCDNKAICRICGLKYKYNKETVTEEM